MINRKRIIGKPGTIQPLVMESGDGIDWYKVDINRSYPGSNFTSLILFTNALGGNPNNSTFKFNAGYNIDLKFTGLTVRTENAWNEAKDIRLYRFNDAGTEQVELKVFSGITTSLSGTFTGYYGMNSGNNMACGIEVSSAFNYASGSFIVRFPSAALVSIPNYQDHTVTKL